MLRRGVPCRPMSARVQPRARAPPRTGVRVAAPNSAFPLVCIERQVRSPARQYATESAPARSYRPLRYSAGPPPRDAPVGPDPEQVEKNLAEWLMTLALVAGLGAALVADSSSQENEPSGKITSQTLGVFMLVGASTFALWAGMDYFQAASALADHIPVRGRTLRIVAFSLFLSGAFAGASMLPPRSSSASIPLPRALQSSPPPS
jgi:hypothetical protein